MGKGVNSTMLKADISHCRHLVQDALGLLYTQKVEEEEVDMNVQNSVIYILEEVETRLEHMEKDHIGGGGSRRKSD
jgi:hypothetical protein